MVDPKDFIIGILMYLRAIVGDVFRFESIDQSSKYLQVKDEAALSAGENIFRRDL